MKINIGTESGNIVGVEIDKKFEDIVYNDIREIVNDYFGVHHGSIIGWCPSSCTEELTPYNFTMIRKELFRKGVYNIPLDKKGMPVENIHCNCLQISNSISPRIFVKKEDLLGFYENFQRK